jgi:hypothetical protein
MRSSSIVFVLFVLAAGPTLAQSGSVTVPAPTPIPAPPQPQLVQIPTSHANAAREMITAAGIADQFAVVAPNVTAQTARMIVQSNIAIQGDVQMRTALEESVRVVADSFATERDQLVATVALIYAVRFSEQELRDIATFFRSPAGQKFSQASPLIAQESIQTASRMAQEIQPVVFERLRAEMRRRGHPLN